MTDKQDRFCEEYMIDLNATQAAIRAGYSPKTAREQAPRLLANVSIQNRIAQLQAEQSRRPVYLLIVSFESLPRLHLPTPAT